MSGSRNIPIQLQTALNSPASTLTRLLKFLLRDGTVYGIAMTNRDVTYDDGDGPLLYTGSNSFDPSVFSSDIAYSVDNAEGYALISDDIPGITIEMVRSGALDDGQWVCYYVDYQKPVAGSAAILDAGDLGEVRTQYGLVWIPELLSYIMRLRQPVGGVYSRTCRAIFGTPANSQTGCGIDITTLWVNFTVTNSGPETNRQFVANLAGSSSHPFFPGRIQWISGANAGQEFATESVTDGTEGTTIVMNETSPFPIAAGDNGRIRPDCDKTETNCNAWDNFVNMKAEPRTPVGDTGVINVPGAQT